MFSGCTGPGPVNMLNKPSVTWATAIFALFFVLDTVDMPCHISSHLQLIHNGLFERETEPLPYQWLRDHQNPLQDTS